MEISCFADSNVKRHQDLLHHGILSECKYILTYNFDELKKNLFEIDTADLVIIHVLTNDIKYICHDQSWKSDYERKNDLISLAHNFVKMIKKLIDEYPDLIVIISMVLKRFDRKDELKMFPNGNKIINAEISKCLLKVENVILIKNDDMDVMDFEKTDKFHLTKKSFEEKLRIKWIKAIGKY